MDYRRAKIQGGTFFFTIVTYERLEILCNPENISLLRLAFRSVKDKYPFKIDAIVVLPNHIHCMLTLPDSDADFPLRIRLIKTYFSRRYRGLPSTISVTRRNKNEKSIWQRRYWEHAIKDEDDYIRHIDYIHYNPVKHGYVSSPKDWKYSSFHKYVEKDIYDNEWGSGNDIVFKDGVGTE